jgi:hypothetical protein
MNTKLTLNVDKSVIRKAKSYAVTRRTSLSKLVENYLKSISEKPDTTMPIAPITAELGTIITKRPKIDRKKAVEDYLTGKYIK